MFDRKTAGMDELLAELGLVKNSGIMMYLFYLVMQQEIPGFVAPNDINENKSDKYFQVNADKVLLPPLPGLTIDDLIKILTFLSVRLDAHKPEWPVAVDSKFYVNVLLPRMQNVFTNITEQNRASLLPFIAASSQIRGKVITKAYQDAIEYAKKASGLCRTNNEIKDKANSFVFQIEYLVNALSEETTLEAQQLVSQQISDVLHQLNDFLRQSPLFSIAFPDFAKSVVAIYQHTSALLQLKNIHGKHAAATAESYFASRIRKHYLKTESCHIFIDGLLAIANVTGKCIKYNLTQSRNFPARLTVEATFQKPINKDKLIAFIKHNGDPYASLDELGLSDAELMQLPGYIPNRFFVREDDKRTCVFHIDGLFLKMQLIPKILQYIADMKTDHPELFEYYASRCREDFYLSFRSECFSIIDETIHQLNLLNLTDGNDENLRLRLIDLLNEILISFGFSDYDKRKTLTTIFHQLFELAQQTPKLSYAVRPLAVMRQWDLESIYCKPFINSYEVNDSTEEASELKEDAVDQFKKLNEMTVTDLKSCSRK